MTGQTAPNRLGSTLTGLTASERVEAHGGGRVTVALPGCLTAMGAGR